MCSARPASDEWFRDRATLSCPRMQLYSLLSDERSLNGPTTQRDRAEILVGSSPDFARGDASTERTDCIVTEKWAGNRVEDCGSQDSMHHMRLSTGVMSELITLESMVVMR